MENQFGGRDFAEQEPVVGIPVNHFVSSGTGDEYFRVSYEETCFLSTTGTRTFRK